MRFGCLVAWVSMLKILVEVVEPDRVVLRTLDIP